jgi:hypothetical protein
MWDKLRNLVSDYLKDEELERYKSILHIETSPSIKSCTILTKQAFDIYNTRAASPASLSGKIRGFKELLEELDKAEDSRVCIHRISSDVQLIVFTNCDITRILGVLTFL